MSQPNPKKTYRFGLSDVDEELARALVKGGFTIEGLEPESSAPADDVSVSQNTDAANEGARASRKERGQ